ncbi:Neuropeptide FF receptor 2 [Trichoplax sp. H2]|nr:Neuropeptide FF receptor 2 [Trichoplax sp. H2]|eukprot:RDD36976.1 Neuropeptide FF receptor 2 [Trichoplax sp. H2]
MTDIGLIEYMFFPKIADATWLYRRLENKSLAGSSWKKTKCHGDFFFNSKHLSPIVLENNTICCNITCKIVFYIYVASITTSTSTLLVIGAERYRAITYPLRRTYTRKQMNRILMAIWAISFSSTLLIIFTRNYDRSSILNCTGSLSPYKSFIAAISFTVYAIATYGIPTVFIIIFYVCIIMSLYYYNLPKGDSEYRAEVNKSRQMKNQVIMALLIITILSAASYFPFMAIHVGIAFLKYSTNNAIKDLPKLFWIFYRLTAILMLIPTILNPILYNFASSEIKKEMKAFTVNLPRISARKCCIHFRKANRLTPVLKM